MSYILCEYSPVLISQRVNYQIRFITGFVPTCISNTMSTSFVARYDKVAFPEHPRYPQAFGRVHFHQLSVVCILFSVLYVFLFLSRDAVVLFFEYRVWKSPWYLSPLFSIHGRLHTRLYDTIFPKMIISYYCGIIFWSWLLRYSFSLCKLSFNINVQFWSIFYNPKFIFTHLLFILQN